MKNLDNQNLFEPMHLAGTIRTADVAWPSLPLGMLISAWAGSLQTEHGMLSKGDMLQWGDDVVAHVRHVGVAIGFARTMSAVVPYLAFVHQCPLYSAGTETFVKQTSSIQVVNAHCIVGACPYAMQANVIVPLLHTTRR